MSTSIDAILAQYEQNKAEKKTTGGQVDLTKYFTTMIPKGVNNGEKTFRILPASDGSPFTEAHWHSVQVGGKWVKLYCPNHNDGQRCPLCEMEEALRLSGNPEKKQLSRQYRARKFYIVKGIDRDNEGEGVKFWRFPQNWKGEGVFDKIVPIIKKRGDITDLNEGRDLTIILGRDDKGYAKVVSIMAEDPAPLTEDKTLLEGWTAHNDTYKDVYRSKSIEYLELVAQGETPIWDNEAKVFVAAEQEGSGNVADLENELNKVDGSDNLSSEQLPW